MLFALIAEVAAASVRNLQNHKSMYPMRTENCPPKTSIPTQHALDSRRKTDQGFFGTVVCIIPNMRVFSEKRRLASREKTAFLGSKCGMVHPKSPAGGSQPKG